MKNDAHMADCAVGVYFDKNVARASFGKVSDFTAWCAGATEDAVRYHSCPATAGVLEAHSVAVFAPLPTSFVLSPA